MRNKITKIKILFGKPFCKNHRALSPIFATLIILGVVTTLFIPVFIWATGVSSSTQESWQSSGAVATERIVIEEIKLVGTTNPNTCTLYVRNIGETAITISNIIISHGNNVVGTYQGSQFLTSNPINGQPITSIVKGNLIKIEISNLNFVLTNGETYTILVATTKGVDDNFLTVALW